MSRTKDLIKLEYYESIYDWSEEEDGSDLRYYGWYITLYVNGKHRVRWNSRRATSKMWPRITKGGDEDCNRAITFVLWPLGHLDIWWEPKWRPIGAGLCDKCKKWIREEG